MPSSGSFWIRLIHVKIQIDMVVYRIISVKWPVTGCWWGNLRERGRWGDPDVDWRIILRWMFRKWEGVVGTGWSWLRIGTGGRALVNTVKNLRVP
jgi:hypothetical protein